MVESFIYRDTMVVMGEYNESFNISIENDEPNMEANLAMHSIKIDHCEEANSINMITNSYAYCSKLNTCDEPISENMESNASTNYITAKSCEQSKTMKVKTNSSCCLDVCEQLNTNSTSPTHYTTIDDCEEANSSTISHSTNCEVEVNEEMNSAHVKSSSSSRCSTINIFCNDTDNTTSIGTIYYNCDTNEEPLQLNKSFPNTTITSPVATATRCCNCETGSSLVYVNTTIIENTNYIEKALVTPVEDALNKCWCEDAMQQKQITSQTSNSLSRSITQHSLKSYDDELPSYRSLIAFRLQDSPPNYESVTGIRVNVDEIRKDVASYARNRLRREVRTCSDLNTSAKRLLVLMSAIIVAICIIMIILTL